jgi:hypothetical protein
MGPNEFRRLHAACLELAGHNVPAVRDRWLTMARGWIELVDKVDQPPLPSQKLAHS